MACCLPPSSKTRKTLPRWKLRNLSSGNSPCTTATVIKTNEKGTETPQTWHANARYCWTNVSTYDFSSLGTCRYACIVMLMCMHGMHKKKKQGELASIVMLVCTSPAEWEGTTESSESLESTAITEAADRSSSSSMRISCIFLRSLSPKVHFLFYYYGPDPSAAGSPPFPLKVTT